jgi:hypothetical protein
VTRWAETACGLGRAVARPRDRARPRRTRGPPKDFVSASTGSSHTQKGTNDAMGHITTRLPRCKNNPNTFVPRRDEDRRPFPCSPCLVRLSQKWLREMTDATAGVHRGARRGGGVAAGSADAATASACGGVAACRTDAPHHEAPVQCSAIQGLARPMIHTLFQRARLQVAF